MNKKSLEERKEKIFKISFKKKESKVIDIKLKELMSLERTLNVRKR